MTSTIGTTTGSAGTGIGDDPGVELGEVTWIVGLPDAAGSPSAAMATVEQSVGTGFLPSNHLLMSTSAFRFTMSERQFKWSVRYEPPLSFPDPLQVLILLVFY